MGFGGLLAAGVLLVHRCDDAATTHADRQRDERVASSGDATPHNAEPSRERARPPARGSALTPADAPARLLQLRLDPSEPDDLKEIRQSTWESITTFASDAQLSNAQFQRFLGDLSDLAKLQDEAERGGMEGMTRDEKHAFWRDQGTELHDRASAYLDERQMIKLRGRFSALGLVTQVRNLGLLEEASEK